MNILFYSDTHLRDVGSFPPFNQIDSNGLSRELNNMIAGFSFIADTIRSVKPKAVINCGDVFHNTEFQSAQTLHGAAVAVGLVSDACRDVGASHDLIPGNHDILNEEHMVTSVSVLKGLVNIHLEPSAIDVDGFRVSLLPFSTDHGRFYSRLMEAKDNCDLLVTHADFKGCQYENGFRSTGKIDPAMFTRPVISGDIHCFSEDTEVLTNKGWRGFREVGTATKVATLNTDTGLLEYQKVEAIVVKDFDGELVNIKTKSCDQLLTPEHRVCARVINRREEGVRPYEDYEFFEAGNPSGQEFALPLNGVLEREPFAISDTEIRLLVWVAADGTIDDGAFRFELKRSEKVERLKSILSQCEADYTMGGENQKGTVRIRVKCEQGASRKVMALLMQSRFKQLPWQVSQFNRAQVLVMLHEYSLTDGTLAGNNMQLLTSKKEEADLIQEACVLAGVSCIMTPKIANEYKIYHCLSINLQRHYVEVHRTRNWSRVSYKGVVWCLTVPNSTLLVRRAGKPFISGNCAQTLQDGLVHYVGSLVQHRFSQYDLARVGGALVFDCDTQRITRYPNTYSKHYIKVREVDLIKTFDPRHVVLQVITNREREEVEALCAGYEFVYLPDVSKKDEPKAHDSDEYAVEEPELLLRRYLANQRPESVEIYDSVMKSRVQEVEVAL